MYQPNPLGSSSLDGDIASFEDGGINSGMDTGKRDTTYYQHFTLKTVWQRLIKSKMMLHPLVLPLPGSLQILTLVLLAFSTR